MTAEGTFRTHDGLQLFRRHWVPTADVRATVVITHGYAEHSGRYAHVARRFNAEGYAVYAFDLRGHGRSEGRRAYVDTFDDYVEDLRGFVDLVRLDVPQPLFLFGHSMGGAIATLYALDDQDHLAGLLLSSPALQVSDDVAPLLRKASTFLGRYLPRLPTITLDPTLLSRDAAVVARVEQDPLYYHGRLPARSGAELIRATRRIEARMEALRLPLLCIHGTADQLTDPRGSRTLYRRAASTDKTLHLFPGFYHETFNEPDSEPVFAALLDWLDDHA